MNYNFLPFDICEMLPKENPYLLDTNDDQSPKWIKMYSEKLLLIGKIPMSTEISYLRDSYTILDALTWLEEKGYYLLVNYSQKQKINNWSYSFVSSGQVRSFITNEYFNSRIEAYTEGIRYCLNLMKDEIK